MACSFLPKQVLCSLSSHSLQRRDKVGGSTALDSYKLLGIVFLRLQGQILITLCHTITVMPKQTGFSFTLLKCILLQTPPCSTIPIIPGLLECNIIQKLPDTFSDQSQKEIQMGFQVCHHIFTACLSITLGQHELFS